MKTAILNGNPDPGNTGFDAYIEALIERLDSQGHEAGQLVLRDMKIRPCTGCFGCWMKEPGQCVIKDDSHEVTRAVVNADFVLFASPIIMGFTSALLKRAHDRLIPLVCPYITLVEGECHHVKRYETYPRVGVLLQQEVSTDAEDIEIITDVYKRNVLNLHSTFSFTKLTTAPVEEVADAIVGR